MRSDLKQYRHDAYRLRNHPNDLDGFVDNRDSFTNVYLSLFPFLAAEYAVEIGYDTLPSGLVFPIGFLLFWAFYYTYYKPGFLEERLSNPHQWDLLAIPALFLGVLIWFMKVTLVELSHLVLLRWILPARATGKQNVPPQAPPPPRSAPQTGPRPASAHAGHKEKPKAPPSALSLELVVALHALGLSESATWSQIHKRYRQLAKEFHPDLNPEKTDHGRRFMSIDKAYRRLEDRKHAFRP